MASKDALRKAPVDSETAMERKQDAEKCLELAREAISDEDYERAQRLLRKAERLHATAEAKQLLDSISNTDRNLNRRASIYHREARNVTGNATDAEKSIEIAQNAFSEGNLAKAERFLLKAERLCQTIRAKDLLRQVRDAKESVDIKLESPKVKAEKKAGLKFFNNNMNNTKDNSVNKPPRPPFTEQQVAAIQRVKDAKTDYEILGVPFGTSYKDSKSAFRKLLLILHPDKNHAPGAKEAFMAVNNAAERLKKTGRFNRIKD